MPYSDWLGEQVMSRTLRVRRDFTQLLSFIHASTIEHRFQRRTSENGRIVANLADYAIVRTLVLDAFQAVQAEGITDADREMVAVVSKLATGTGKGVSQADIRAETKASKSTVSYRINRLLESGHVIDKAERKGKGNPQQLMPGAPLPEEVVPLPTCCELAKILLDRELPDLIEPWVDPTTGDIHMCLENNFPDSPLNTTNTNRETAVLPCQRVRSEGANSLRTLHTDPEEFGESSGERKNSLGGGIAQETWESSKSSRSSEDVEETKNSEWWEAII